jgi:antitoxin StbD
MGWRGVGVEAAYLHIFVDMAAHLTAIRIAAGLRTPCIWGRKNAYIRSLGAFISAIIDAQEGIHMTHLILTDVTASISELKRNPMGTVAAGEGSPVAILNRNAPAFYCVPADAYEAMMEKFEDLELNAIADARISQPIIKVTLDEL